MIIKTILLGTILSSMLFIAKADRFIPADSKGLEYSDYAVLNFITVAGKKVARMNRPLSSRNKGYNWDNPGARLRFKTNAKNITVHLIYSDKHISTSARQPVGMYYIDYKSQPKWIFLTSCRKVVRPIEKVNLKLPVSNDNKFHLYEIIMPYGDSVDVAGITVNDNANFTKPNPRPKFRCAIYGDSITQGFTGTSVNWIYAYRLAHIKHWQLINLGIGGRASNPHDGTTIGEIKHEQLIVLMGVNDWQGGRPVEQYKKHMKKFITNYRKLQKNTPIYLITPLWVPETWKPRSAKFKLEAYRQGLREIVSEIKDPKIKLIEGSKLIDHDKKYFDRIAVHPNNSGFAQMTKRLLKKIR